MKKSSRLPIDIAKADEALIAWWKKYNTLEKVAAQHRKKILDRVVESMAFEGESVSKARLKALLKKEGRLSRSAKNDG